MSAKYFLDTNVFVYSFDSAAPKKQEVAKSLIRKALTDRRGVTSIQVVQEFFNVAVSKFKKKLSIADARLYLESVFKPLCETYTDIGLVRSALTIHQEVRYSWYDSLIVAGAITSGCTILYSEDLQDGRRFEGLEIENPFKLD